MTQVLSRGYWRYTPSYSFIPPILGHFWVTDPFNVPFANLNYREPSLAAPSVEEKERPGVEVA